MRKTLLLGGLALLLAGTVFAGQRNRGGESVRSRTDASFEGSNDGHSSLLSRRPDGVIALREVLEEYGSVHEFMRAIVLDEVVPSAPGPDGLTWYANGAMPFSRDVVGDIAPSRSFEEWFERRKESVP